MLSDAQTAGGLLIAVPKRKSNILLDSKITISFGVTSTTFEALEKGNEVIQICSDPVFESLNEKYGRT